VLAVTLAMIVLATIFVFFRLVSRIGIVRKMSADDYFMIVAWVCRSLCLARLAIAHSCIFAGHSIWVVLLDMLRNQVRVRPS
jgi:hypothetical protein